LWDGRDANGHEMKEGKERDGDDIRGSHCQMSFQTKEQVNDDELKVERMRW
jgi:hypothetical protein